MSGGGNNTVTSQPSPWNQALANISQDQYNFLQSNIAPVQNQYMAKVNNMNQDYQVSNAEGAAQSGLMSEVAPAEKEAESGLLSKGLGANSGSTIMGTNGINLAGAKKLSGAGTAGGVGHIGNYFSGLENIAGMGSGEAGNAVQGLRSVNNQYMQENQAMQQSSAMNAASLMSGLGGLASVGLALAAL